MVCRPASDVLCSIAAVLICCLAIVAADDATQRRHAHILSTAAIPTTTVELLTAAKMESDWFNDPDEPVDLAKTVIRLRLSNGSFTSNDVKPIFTTGLSVRDDPRGFAATETMFQPVVSVAGAEMNLSWTGEKCYAPNEDDKLYISINPADTTVGNEVVAAVVDMQIPKFDGNNRGGVTVVGIVMILIMIIFLMDGWCDALITLLQLQTLISISTTKCAPLPSREVFASADWVVWPISPESGSSTAEIQHGRMTVNWVFVISTIALQSVLFWFFVRVRGKTASEALTQIRVPAASLVVATSLYLGSMQSSAGVFSRSYLGELHGDTGTTWLLAITTQIFLLLQLGMIFFAVFRYVSREVYVENYHTTFLTRAIFGGRWQDEGMIRRWGILYADLGGSAFWFIGAMMFLLGISAVCASFRPSSRSSCTTQFYLILAPNAVVMVMMFVNRPFKSMMMNFLHTSVTTMNCLQVAAFITAMTCSRNALAFTSVATWLVLLSVLFKTMVVFAAMLYQLVDKTIKDAKEAAEKADYAPSWASPLRMNRDEHVEMQAAELTTLDAARVDESGMTVNIAFKPTLPVPTTIGPSLVTRAVGFGPRGGLQGHEGPSLALQLNEPNGVCCEGQHVYIVDTAMSRVLKHSLTTLRTETLGGGNGVGYFGDRASALRARLNKPRGCCIGQQCIYVADTENNAVRRIDFASLHIHTVVGGTEADRTIALHRPYAVTTLGSVLFIADTMNHRVIAFELETNTSNVIAGRGAPGFDGNGLPGPMSRLTAPQGLAVDKRRGLLYIADTGNHRVVVIDPVDKRMKVVIGVSGAAGDPIIKDRRMHLDASTRLNLPTDVACLRDGSILVADGGNARVLLVRNAFNSAAVISAVAIVPPNDHCIPRCLCVTPSSASTSRGDISYDNDSEIVFHVSDPLSGLVCHVDATPTGPREVVFAQTKLNAMATEVNYRGRDVYLRSDGDEYTVDGKRAASYDPIEPNVDHHDSTMRDPNVDAREVSISAPKAPSGTLSRVTSSVLRSPTSVSQGSTHVGGAGRTSPGFGRPRSLTLTEGDAPLPPALAAAAALKSPERLRTSMSEESINSSFSFSRQLSHGNRSRGTSLRRAGPPNVDLGAPTTPYAEFFGSSLTSPTNNLPSTQQSRVGPSMHSPPVKQGSLTRQQPSQLGRTPSMGLMSTSRTSVVIDAQQGTPNLQNAGSPRVMANDAWISLAPPGARDAPSAHEERLSSGSQNEMPLGQLADDLRLTPGTIGTIASVPEVYLPGPTDAEVGELLGERMLDEEL